MEKEKDANKVVEEMMNHIRELFPSLDDEESYQEEFEDTVEDIHVSTPPAHKDEEMVIFSHTNSLMKEPFDMVDEHIDIFIQTSKRKWDFGCLIFDRDPIYDIEGTPQEKGFELSSSENWSSRMYDSDVWQSNDDIITDLFRPLEDDLSQHT
jgi:hypothetical protein